MATCTCPQHVSSRRPLSSVVIIAHHLLITYAVIPHHNALPTHNNDSLLVIIPIWPKVGALLEVPEAARAERHAREKRQAAEDRERAQKRQAHIAREAEWLSAIHAADAAAYHAMVPVVAQWAAGEGDEKANRR